MLTNWCSVFSNSCFQCVYFQINDTLSYFDQRFTSFLKQFLPKYYRFGVFWPNYPINFKSWFVTKQLEGPNSFSKHAELSKFDISVMAEVVTNSKLSKTAHPIKRYVTRVSTRGSCLQKVFFSKKNRRLHHFGRILLP